jgi:hypothetical protein
LTPRLISIAEAAARLGDVPVKPLAKAALDHGFLVRIGSSSFLVESELEGLVSKCRQSPKVPASCGGNVKTPTSSKTLAGSNAARARQIVEKLKSPLPNTSPAHGGVLVPLNRGK